MPLTVIVLKNTPPSLRGDLTKWMQEISTGVYVGNFNRKVREKLWLRVIENVKEGDATICFASRNEIGYEFMTNSKEISIIDFDGIPLVMKNAKEVKMDDKPQKLGFSNASKFLKAKQFQKTKKTTKPYAVLDIETDGLDIINNSIIEIGCVKVLDNKTYEFQNLIKIDSELPEEIKKLTGISDKILKEEGLEEKTVLKNFIEFIEDLPIITYGNNFDINFLNQALIKNGYSRLKNQAIDLMRLVKKEKRTLDNYKLQTALSAYNIDKKVPHRALEDAKLTLELSYKVNLFKEKIGKDS